MEVETKLFCKVRTKTIRLGIIFIIQSTNFSFGKEIMEKNCVADTTETWKVNVEYNLVACIPAYGTPVVSGSYIISPLVFTSATKF